MNTQVERLTYVFQKIVEDLTPYDHHLTHLSANLLTGDIVMSSLEKVKSTSQKRKKIKIDLLISFKRGGLTETAYVQGPLIWCYTPGYRYSKSMDKPWQYNGIIADIRHFIYSFIYSNLLFLFPLKVWTNAFKVLSLPMFLLFFPEMCLVCLSDSRLNNKAICLLW